MSGDKRKVRKNSSNNMIGGTTSHSPSKAKTAESTLPKPRTHSTDSVTSIEEFPGIIIVGAGLVGSLTALMFAQNGYKVKIFESRSDFREFSQPTNIPNPIGQKAQTKTHARSAVNAEPVKRSINLALSLRGQEALKSVGLLDDAMKLAVPMYGRSIHTQTRVKRVDEKKNFVELLELLKPDQVQLYDEIEPLVNHNNSISREGLNRLLLNALDKLKGKGSVEVFFRHKLVEIDRDMVCHVKVSEKGSGRSKKQLKIRAKLVVGCDGAYSAVRESLMRHNHSNFHQTYISHGYKEFHLDLKELSKLQSLKDNYAAQINLMDSSQGSSVLGNIESIKDVDFRFNGLHIWPRGDFMMIALPNKDHTFTCTLFAPFKMLLLKNDQDIRDYFQKYFLDVTELIPDYCEQYKANPTCKLVSIQLDNWHSIKRFSSTESDSGAYEHFDDEHVFQGDTGSEHSVLVIGDAAHACVPFFGQGMNCGFEDVLELSLLLNKGDEGNLDGLGRIVEEFGSRRVDQAQGCGVLSYNNYREMSSHTGSYWFLFEKKIVGLMNYVFGNRFIPLYKMVTFTRIPYDEVIEREKRQQKILHGIEISTMLSFALAVGCCSAAAVKYYNSNVQKQ